nr:hypothetical protein [Lentibacillus daqui]
MNFQYWINVQIVIVRVEEMFIVTVFIGEMESQKMPHYVFQSAD